MKHRLSWSVGVPWWTVRVTSVVPSMYCAPNRTGTSLLVQRTAFAALWGVVDNRTVWSRGGDRLEAEASVMLVLAPKPHQLVRSGHFVQRTFGRRLDSPLQPCQVRYQCGAVAEVRSLHPGYFRSILNGFGQRHWERWVFDNVPRTRSPTREQRRCNCEHRAKF